MLDRMLTYARCAVSNGQAPLVEWRGKYMFLLNFMVFGVDVVYET